MSQGPQPAATPPTHEPPPPAGIMAAAPSPDAVPVEWVLSVPPASLSSLAEGLTGPAQHPALPATMHMQIEGQARSQTIWNPLEGDPLRMAALGASAGVQTGLTSPALAMAGSAAPPPGANGSRPRAQMGGSGSGTAPVSTTLPGARIKHVTDAEAAGEREQGTMNVTVASASSASSSGAVAGGAAYSRLRVPRSQRIGALAAAAVALLIMGAGVLAIWIGLPPRSVVQVTIAFEQTGGGALDEQVDAEVLREVHLSQENLLWSEKVRRAAADSLRQRDGLGPGFLFNLRQLTHAARISWDAEGAGAGGRRQEMMLQLSTTTPDADARRLTELFQALHDANAVRNDARNVDALKLQLLETEVADFTREADYLRRRVKSLEEELRMLRLGAPKEGEIDRLKHDVDRLSTDYQNALTARIRAEVQSALVPADEAAEAAAATMPATEGESSALRYGPAIERFRQREREALVELRTAENELARAMAQQESIEQKQREINGVNDTLDSLARSVEQKQKELADAKAGRQAAFRPVAPAPARVVQRHDARPLWIGVVVALVSVAYALYVALGAVGGGKGSGVNRNTAEIPLPAR